MKIVPTELEGVFVIETDMFVDDRGFFTKTFHKHVFEEHGLESDFEESFYSISKKDVIRGMHFHLPPKDHAKLVYVTRGSVLDVTLDIRKNSPTFGKYITTLLSQDNHTMMYIESTNCGGNR
jgi:dTDP-4-dehydrorhamnose 3,5-epimerase